MTRNLRLTMTRNTFTEAAQAAFLMQRKEGNTMACKHERIKSVNCVIYCDVCGEKLPVDYLVAKPRIAEQKAQETAAEGKTKEDPSKPEKAAKTPADGQKTASRKKVTKK